MTFLRYWMLLFTMQFLVEACHNTNGSTEKKNDVVDSITNGVNSDTAELKHSQTIQTFWSDFQRAIQENNTDTLIALTHFPLAGIAPFTDANGSTTGTDTTQFLSALPDILAKVPREQILRTSADSLLIIDKKDLTQQISGSEPLLKKLDADSKIYLCYVQWADDNGKETNQTFILAKIYGEYKLCGIAWRGGIY